MTYPVATLKKLVDVYTLNSANFTTVTASTLARAKELVTLYESLGSYQSQVTKFDIEKIKKEIELFENPTLIPIEDLNKQPVISEVTPQNLADAQAIVAAYDKLSSADQKKVTYPVENVRALLKVYEINLVTWTEVTAQNLEQTEAAIKLYGQLDSAHYTKVKVNINDLKNAVTAYKFIKDYIGKDISIYEIAVGFMANYNVLDNPVKQIVKNKLNVNAALATIEAKNLQDEITSLKAEIAVFITEKGVTTGNVKDAKPMLQKVLNSSNAVQSALSNEITKLKQNIAYYDYMTYGMNYILPAKRSAFHVSIKDENQVITRQEIFYWAHMFNEMSLDKRKTYLKDYPDNWKYSDLNPRDVISGAKVSFELYTHYIDDKNYLVKFNDDGRYGVNGNNITYEFEQNYKYTSSKGKY